MKTGLFFTCLLVVGLSFSKGQNKYLDRVEADIIKGRYLQASPVCKSNVNRYAKSKDYSSEYVKALSQLAHVQFGLAKFNTVDSILNLASAVAEGNPFLLHGVYLRGADIWLAYGSTIRANQYLEKAKALGFSQGQHHLNFRVAKLRSLNADFNGAREYIPQLKEVFKADIVKKISVTHPNSGKERMVSLSKFEQERRKLDYTNVLNLEVEILLNQGNLADALKINLENEKPIKKLSSKKSTGYVDNQYFGGLILSDSGERQKSIKLLKNAQKQIGKRAGNLIYTKGSERYFTVCEALMAHYLRYGDRSEAQKISNKYSKAVQVYTKRNPVFMKRHLINAQAINRNKKSVLTATNNILRALGDTLNLPVSHPLRITAFSELALIHKMRGDMRMLENAFVSRLEVASKLYPDQSPVFQSYLLDLLAHQVNYTNDLKFIEQEVNQRIGKILIPQLSETHVTLGKFYETKSRMAELGEDFKVARDFHNRYTKMAESKFGFKSVEFGVALSRGARIETQAGDYKNAEDLYKKSIDVLRGSAGTKSQEYSMALENLAELYTIQGDFDKAEDLLLKSQKISKKALRNMSVSDGSTTSNFIDVYILTGRYSEAENILNKNIELKTKQYGQGHRELITPYNQLGKLHFIKGNYSESEKHTKNAAKISEKVFSDSSLKFAESQKLLGQIYLAMGNFDKAEQTEMAVLKTNRKLLGENHIAVAESYNQLALVGIYQQKPDSIAEKNFMKALNIISSNLGKESPKYADVAKNLAFFYSETGQLEKAGKSAEEAESIYRDKIGKKNVYQADIKMLEGDINLKSGKYKDALSSYQASMKLYESIFGNEHPSFVKAQSKTARTYYIMGDYQKALGLATITTDRYLTFARKYFPSLSDREKNNYWAVIKNEFEFFNSLCTKLLKSKPELAGQMYNISLNTKAILLNSSMKVRQSILNSNDELLIALYKEWLRKREELAASLSLSNEEMAAQNINRTQLMQEVESLEKSLVEKSSLFASAYESSFHKWQEVAQKLKADEAIVEIIRFRYFDKDFTDSVIYAALVIASPTQKQPALTFLGNGQDLENKHIRFYRNSVRYLNDESESYKHFWQPIRNQTAGKSTVFVSPDGVYSQINLLTLRDETGKYVIDQNNVILVSSSRDMFERDKENSLIENNKLVALFGNPEFYVQLDPKSIKKPLENLSGAIEEIYQVRRTLKKGGWDSYTIINELATEDTIKKLGGPRVFHIATHGFFMESKPGKLSDLGAVADNPLLRSGIFLTGGGDVYSDNIFEFNREPGILTAYEVMNLDFDDTELVVLSACETGLGEVKTGEGVYGLQRAFLVSGAKSIIMSLFKVSDQTTQELMTEFYSNWLTSGDRRDAFLKAQQTMKERYGKPLYWGAFNMVGI